MSTPYVEFAKLVDEIRTIMSLADEERFRELCSSNDPEDHVAVYFQQCVGTLREMGSQ